MERIVCSENNKKVGYLKQLAELMNAGKISCSFPQLAGHYRGNLPEIADKLENSQTCKDIFAQIVSFGTESPIDGYCKEHADFDGYLKETFFFGVSEVSRDSISDEEAQSADAQWQFTSATINALQEDYNNLMPSEGHDEL